MIKNIEYMMKNWINWDKKSLIYLLIRIPALVLLPIITAYIPKAMIDCIQKGVTVEKFILVVALLSVCMVAATWLSTFLGTLVQGSTRIIRMRYAVMAFNKNLTSDYIDIESLGGQESNKRAMEFYKNDESSASAFIENFTQIAVSVVGVIVSCVLLYIIDYYIVLIIIFTCIIQAFAIWYSYKCENELMNKTSKIITKFDYFYELSKDTSSSKDIKIYGFSDMFLCTIAKLVDSYRNAVDKFMRQSRVETGVSALFTLIRELVAYAYLVYLVYKGELGVSNFIFYFGIITGFSNWIVSLVYSIGINQKYCDDCAAFRNFVETKAEIEKEKIHTSFDKIESIEFKDVSFAYPGNEKNTINNMSFKINKGEKIAIVGENGAGKTTAIKLLCGLYKPTYGEITVNGKNINKFSKDDYFDLFSVVFQDYYFLPMTIAENISVEDNCDKEKLFFALNDAGILDKINALDQKENSLMVKEVYKDAIDFSGGEKQKLLLAKAVYKNAPILILDEPTAALDPISENELYLKYNELSTNKISFFISHRLSSTRFCDRIFFIKDGKIVESGTHNELMKKKGNYYRMYQVQSYYYKEGGKMDNE